MKNKSLTSILFFIGGLILGLLIYQFLIDTSQNSQIHIQENEKELYSCGMHPNIVEDEPGTCPICGMNLTPIKRSAQNISYDNHDKKTIYWRAPMDPNEIYDKPGKSKMGMELVPVYEDQLASSNIVTVDGHVIQSMNVKMELVKEMSISSTISTNGILDIDERKELSVTSKYDGWIEKLYVNFTGQKIEKGDKLADIYSPELIAVQEELLSVLKYSSDRSNAMLVNAKRKLELLDISKDNIEKLIDSKLIRKYITLYAPFKGTVITKSIIEGEKLTAGEEILRIADLSSLWLKADIYESEIQKINRNSKILAKFNNNPGKIYEGKISFIDPIINHNTRTFKIRADIKNLNNELKPGMFAQVEITGKNIENSLAVPEEAVIRSGKDNRVILYLGNGKFKPVNVELGLYSEGHYQIISGLKLNDKIVSSGQFMIDSESSLRSAIRLYSDESVGNLNELNKNIIEEKQNNQASKIIHQGIIDLNSIDENNDGNLFECPMDWNVISDKDGRCPLCKMFLKEYTIEEVKNNLKEHNFEYR